MRYILTFFLVTLLVSSVSAVELDEDDVELRISGTTDDSYSFSIYGGESHTQELEVLVFDSEVSGETLDIQTVIEAGEEEYEGSLVETQHPDTINVDYGSNFFDITTETSHALRPVDLTIITSVGVAEEEEEDEEQQDDTDDESGGAGGGTPSNGDEDVDNGEDTDDTDDTDEDTDDADDTDDSSDEDSDESDEEVTVIDTDIDKDEIRYPIRDSITQTSSLSVINFVSIVTIGIFLLLMS